MLKRVPFQQVWCTDDGPDLHAIYERPVRGDDDQPVRDAFGRIRYDLTGPLPVRRHNAWLMKGFRYVTLADRASLETAAPFLMAQGLNPSDYLHAHDLAGGPRGPWSLKAYLASVQDSSSTIAGRITSLVAEHGPEAVEAIMREQDPSFSLPEEYRQPANAVPIKAPAEDVAPRASTPRRRPGRPRKEQAA